MGTAKGMSWGEGPIGLKICKGHNEGCWHSAEDYDNGITHHIRLHLRELLFEVVFYFFFFLMVYFRPENFSFGANSFLFA